jgi:hypothetical protein
MFPCFLCHYNNPFFATSLQKSDFFIQNLKKDAMLKVLAWNVNLQGAGT